jgi:hypothetical protein
MKSCGAEVAESAIVPDAVGALMRHVAENLDAHASWVGRETPEAQAEHDGLREIAVSYRALAESAEHAARAMRRLGGLAPVPHDPSRWDRPTFVAWMRTKIELQRRLASILLSHADVAAAVLDET